jgi:hypothetical protein
VVGHPEFYLSYTLCCSDYKRDFRSFGCYRRRVFFRPDPIFAEAFWKRLFLRIVKCSVIAAPCPYFTPTTPATGGVAFTKLAL